MELLETETFNYECYDKLIEPVHYAFFKEEDYHHYKAVLAFLAYQNQVWVLRVPRLVPI
ncbi:hypothetical protein AALA44_10305 [Enterococcus ratti]|uniref:hypothetical protein n=1 Tax=Enterococcus ratti TaxID=150033 RepID=UPI003517B7BC